MRATIADIQRLLGQRPFVPFLIATRSGHHIQLDEPELVIKSIREVLAAVRK